MMEALENIEREKGISIEIMLEALANALLTAYKRMPDAAEEALVEIDMETGDQGDRAGARRGQQRHASGTTRHRLRPHRRRPPSRSSSSASVKPKREMKYEEYAAQGDIVTGIIQQTDARYTLLDLGKVEALLPQAEQVQNEHYDHGSRLKAYIVEVRKTAKGPQIVVSHAPRPGEAALRARGPRDRRRGRRLKASPASPATARRSRCRRTTTTSTRSAPASVAWRTGPHGRQRAAARRSTSSPTTTTRPSS
jgi:hypothetical protein